MKTKAKKSKPKAEKPATKKRGRPPKNNKKMKEKNKSAKSTEQAPPQEAVQLSGSSAVYTTKAEYNGLPAGTQFKERTDQRWQAYDAEGNQLDVIMNRVDMEGNPNVFQQTK